MESYPYTQLTAVVYEFIVDTRSEKSD